MWLKPTAWTPPPDIDRRLWAGPAGHEIRSFFWGVRQTLLNLRFLAAVAFSAAPGLQNSHLRPPFGSLFGTHLHQIGDSGPLARTLLFIMFSIQIHTSGEGGCRSKTILAPVVHLKARFSQLVVVLLGPGPRQVRKWTSQGTPRRGRKHSEFHQNRA